MAPKMKVRVKRSATPLPWTAHTMEDDDEVVKIKIDAFASNLF